MTNKKFSPILIHNNTHTITTTTISFHGQAALSKTCFYRRQKSISNSVDFKKNLMRLHHTLY